MNKQITKTFISDQGEIFEGSQKELMNQYGIKQRNGFKRASGAVDANGDRWKEYTDDVEFKKPKLYLGFRKVYDKDSSGNSRVVQISPSETAANYILALKYPELMNEMKQLIESQYEIIDNREPCIKKKGSIAYWRSVIVQLKKDKDHAAAELKKGDGSEAKFWGLMYKLNSSERELSMAKTVLNNLLNEQ